MSSSTSYAFVTNPSGDVFFPLPEDKNKHISFGEFDKIIDFKLTNQNPFEIGKSLTFSELLYLCSVKPEGDDMDMHFTPMEEEHFLGFNLVDLIH